MSTLKLPDDFNMLPQIIVREGSPAHTILLAMCQAGGAKPGAIIAISDEEFDSLKEDVMVVLLEMHRRALEAGIQ